MATQFKVQSGELEALSEKQKQNINPSASNPHQCANPIEPSKLLWEKGGKKEVTKAAGGIGQPDSVAQAALSNLVLLPGVIHITGLSVTALGQVFEALWLVQLQEVGDKLGNYFHITEIRSGKKKEREEFKLY